MDKIIYIESDKHRKKKKRSKFLKAFSLFLFISLLITSTYFYLRKNPITSLATTNPTPTPTPEVIETPMTDLTLSRVDQNPSNEEIMAKIQEIMDENSDLDIAVSFYDLKNNNSFNINGDTPFTAASTTKLIAAGALIKEIEEGKRSYKDPLNGLTTKNQLWYLLNQSNNDSWDAINEEVPFATQEAFAKSLGINTFDSSKNTIAANSLTLFMVKLAQGKILNPENTTLFLDYITKTNDETFLPQGLSSDLLVCHKYGIYNGNAHDTGIIKGQNSWYVLTIMSKDTAEGEDYTARADVFHQITALFVDYK